VHILINNILVQTAYKICDRRNVWIQTIRVI